MRRGEVRWYKFTKPDKRRPAVILTRDPLVAVRRGIGVIKNRVRPVKTETREALFVVHAAVRPIVCDVMFCRNESALLIVEHR